MTVTNPKFKKPRILRVEVRNGIKYTYLEPQQSPKGGGRQVGSNNKNKSELFGRCTHAYGGQNEKAEKQSSRFSRPHYDESFIKILK